MFSLHFILYYSLFNIGNYFCVRVHVFLSLSSSSLSPLKKTKQKKILNHPRIRRLRINWIAVIKFISLNLPLQCREMTIRSIQNTFHLSYFSCIYRFVCGCCCVVFLIRPGLWQQHKENEMRHHCHVTYCADISHSQQIAVCVCAFAMFLAYFTKTGRAALIMYFLLLFHVENNIILKKAFCFIHLRTYR